MKSTAKHKPFAGSLLLATDFSEPSQAAFKACLDICRVMHSTLYILNVFEYANVAPPESGGLMIDLAQFRADAELSLRALIDEAQSHGIETGGGIGTGVSSVCILDHVSSQKIDLVVLGTRAIHGFERLVFGSTAEAVLRKSACPVLTVGPQANPRTLEMGATVGAVVFATDFHATTTGALTYAASFAASMALPLHCLSVLPRGAKDGTRKGVISIIITEALQHLAANVDGAKRPPICSVVYGSEISNAVVQYAREHDAKLIVLGVRRASLMASHIPAHIAYRIITEAPCPVLTIAYPYELDAAYPPVYGAHESELNTSVRVQ